MVATVLKWFFLSLGVVFFCLIVSGVYLYIADPFKVRPLIDVLLSHPASEPHGDEGQKQEGDVIKDRGEVDAEAVTNTEVRPQISAGQQEALQSAGIDVSRIPETITPEMEACFVAELGEARTREIAEGATPTLPEIFRARYCVE